MARRVSFVVHGTVQGVSFRYFTRKKATAYGLNGWVRNTANGEVEGEAQGEDDSIEKLLKDLSKGPTHARVVKLDKNDIELRDGDTSFEVRG